MNKIFSHSRKSYLQTKRSVFSTQRAFYSNFANKVLMVEPTNFFLNEETFEDNKFMNKVNLNE